MCPRLYVRHGHDASRFLRDFLVVGTHLESLRNVSSGRARAAAVDCVTYGLLAVHAPHELAGIRVVGMTAEAPALPYVTSIHTSTDIRRRLINGLREALLSPSLASVRDALSISGLEALTKKDYAFMQQVTDHGS